MKSVIVLQARTNSSRLPGKVLLPIGGLPIAILAARRAANTGRGVLVATSRESSDDALTRLLRENDIACYRGSLENTLGRVVEALSGYDDETLVFRLTADNVFPDGALLDEMERDFLQRNLDYLCCNGKASGLPYGMSAELTRLKHLRQAAASTRNQHDRQHVTPFVRRQFGDIYFDKYQSLAKGYLRSTIDCLDDYLLIQQVFADVKNAVAVSAFELLDRLEAVSPPYAPGASKLVLGTVQLGMDYGIANTTGQPPLQTATALIKRAISQGVDCIDTARAYGNSESVIGSVLRSGWGGRARVVTKLSPLAGCDVATPVSTVKALVDTSVYESCLSLGVQYLDVLMLHRASHLHDWNGAAWSRLRELQQEGRIGQLGASVQSPKELEWCLETPEIRFVQLPCNVLDWRWDDLIPMILAKKKETGLQVHARSTLLQGLLTSCEVNHWKKAGVENPGPIIQWLKEQAASLGKSSVASFCLAMLVAQEWVDGVVVGMETMQQLEENLAALGDEPLSVSTVNNIIAQRPRLTEVSLDPAQWQTTV